MAGVEYQVTKVDPTDPETKGMVYQVHKVSEEVAATLGGKVYRARIVKVPDDPEVSGMVYQIVLIDDPDDPSVKGKVYNAILTGGSEAVVVGPAVSPLDLPDAIADSLVYVKAFGGTEQRNLPDNYIERQFIYMMDGSYLLTDIVPTYDGRVEMDFQTTSIQSGATSYLGGRNAAYPAGLRLGTGSGNSRFVVTAFSDSAYTATTSAENNTRYKFTFNNKVATLESGGSTLFTYTFTGENANGAALVINGLNSDGTITANTEGIYLYSFKAWNAQGELVMNLVPAIQKGTVPVVGFYDTVSETFMTATSGTFAAGGEAVPTPDAPMDIVCNNGVLKARHESGLPLGYTLLDYIATANSSYIDTGITPTINAKADIKFVPTQTTTTGYWGARSDPNRFCCTTFISGAQFGVGMTNNTWPANRTAVVLDSIYDCVIANGYVNVNGTEYTETPVESFENANTFRLGKIVTSGGSNYSAAKYYKCKLWENNVLVFDGIPAKNANDVIGMYDLVSGQFFTNAGTGDFVAGDPVSDPIEIYTDGTVETIAIKDDQSATISTATCEDLLSVGDYTDEQEVISGAVTRKVGVLVLDGTENWTSTTSGSNWMFYINSSGQSIANGLCVCNVATGRANAWTSSPNIVIVRSNSNFGFMNMSCTTINSTVADWKQWLAAQYAAGTPVIIVYPLATSTTETVTGQPMQTAEGDNVVEITQASMDGLELQVTYEKEG